MANCNPSNVGPGTGLKRPLCASRNIDKKIHGALPGVGTLITAIELRRVGERRFCSRAFICAVSNGAVVGFARPGWTPNGWPAVTTFAPPNWPAARLSRSAAASATIPFRATRSGAACRGQASRFAGVSVTTKSKIRCAVTSWT